MFRFLLFLVSLTLSAQTIRWSQIRSGESPFINAKSAPYNAKGDTKTAWDGAITSGTDLLSSASIKFALGDVGKTISVTGAGTAGALLTTTILSYVGPTQVHLATTAARTVPAVPNDATAIGILIYGTDDTAKINAALTASIAGSSPIPVFLPPGKYLVTDAVAMAAANAVLVTEGSSVTTLVVSPAFNPSAAGVITHTWTNTIKGLSIDFLQPDTATRGSLTTYPPAIYSATGADSLIEDIVIRNGTIGVKEITNSSRVNLTHVKIGAFTTGVYLDGSYDSTPFTDVQFYPFQQTVLQYTGITLTSGSTGFDIGRVDGLSCKGCAAPAVFRGFHFHDMGAGTSWAHLSSSMLGDGTGNILVEGSSAKVEISGSTITASDNNTNYIIKVIDGAVNISSSWLAVGGSADADALVYALQVSGTGALTITGCNINAAGSGATNAVKEFASASDTSILNISNSLIVAAQASWQKAGVPWITILGNSTLIMTGNYFTAPGSTTNSLITFATDYYHRIQNNNFNGWNLTLPTGQLVLGEYQQNPRESLALTAQASAITTTNFDAAVKAGTYQFSSYIHTTTQSTGACTGALAITWIYNSASKSKTLIASHSLAVDETASDGSFVFRSDAGSAVTYAFTLTGGANCANGIYDLYMVMEPIQH